MSAIVPDHLPRIRLDAPDGAQAEIALHGGHVLSWRTPDARERLFLSPRASFDTGAAIRGGVPVIFPQFAGLGPLPKHGLARTATWQHVDSQITAGGAAVARLRLTEDEASRSVWDYAFQLDLIVTIGGSRLDLALQVTNTDMEAYRFMAALHTYLAVQAIEDVAVEGLAGLSYRERGVDGAQPDGALRIEGEVDRIYWNVPGPLILREGAEAVKVAALGFPDVVVWNPGPALAAKLPDLDPEGYRRMLCIEAALIGAPVTLAPGANWRGTQTITAL